MSTTGGPSAGPLSRVRTRSPERSSTWRTRTAGSPAGYIAAGARRPDGVSCATCTAASERLDRPAGEAGGQTESEGGGGPSGLAIEILLERGRGADEGIRAARRGRPLMWMPHAVAVPVVEEPVEQLRPVLVPAQEAQPRHQLQPVQRRRNVGVHRVAVRQQVAEHEMRLRDEMLAAD